MGLAGLPLGPQLALALFPLLAFLFPAQVALLGLLGALGLALLGLLLAAEEVLLPPGLPGLLLLLGQGFVLLAGLGLPLAEGDLLIQALLALGPALLLGVLLEPADKADDHKDQRDEEHQPHVDVSQHGVHAGDEGHKGGEGHVGDGGHIHNGIFLAGVDDGDGAQYIPGLDGGGGHVGIQMQA